MLRKLLVVLFLSVLTVACANSITGSTEPPTPTYPSAHGTLPEWLYFEGHLPFILDCTYEMYFGSGIGEDPELSAAIERWMTAANTMTRGRVRFIRSFRSNASFSIAIAPEKLQNPTALAQNQLSIEIPTYIIRSGHISLRVREYALNNVALHEIGHSLFGPGHSGAQGDILGIRDYSQPTFSASEEDIWHRARAIGAGATAMSRTEISTMTIIVD